MKLVCAFAVACVLGALPLAAAADPPQTAIGITINPAFGVHESFNDTVHVPPVPAPFLELDQTLGPFELYAQGLPPTVAIPYQDAIQGQTWLRITILDGTLRIFEPSHRFAVGVGETIYNQTTHYATADFYPNTGQQQYSRIVGAHYELFARLPLRAGKLETSLRYAPVLLGTQVSTYESSPALTRYDPERGEQIDGEIRYVHRAGKHSDAIIGIRYVNFTAVYDVPSRPLSDRNAGILPSFGFLWRLGP
jgi:hypothetical protein